MMSMEMASKLHSKAFRQGFVCGFSAPLQFFVPTIRTREHVYHATIDSAWKMVEDSLNESFVREKALGKNAGKNESKSRKAA
jgi:hypothetical protein